MGNRSPCLYVVISCPFLPPQFQNASVTNFRLTISPFVGYQSLIDLRNLHTMKITLYFIFAFLSAVIAQMSEQSCTQYCLFSPPLAPIGCGSAKKPDWTCICADIESVGFITSCISSCFPEEQNGMFSSYSCLPTLLYPLEHGAHELT